MDVEVRALVLSLLIAPVKAAHVQGILVPTDVEGHVQVLRRLIVPVQPTLVQGILVLTDAEARALVRCCLIVTVQPTPVQEQIVLVRVAEVRVQGLRRPIVPAQVIRAGMMFVVMGAEAYARARIVHVHLM